MEQTYFRPENLNFINNTVLAVLENKMPKNTIDKKGVNNIILNNMKTIARNVDNNKINQSNYKKVLEQINKLAIQTTLKQIGMKEKSNVSAVQFQRDNDLRMFSKINPYGDKQQAVVSVERPMISAGSKDISQSYDTLMAEREKLDSMIGVRKPPTYNSPSMNTPSMNSPAMNLGSDEFGSVDNNDSFSDISAFNSTITNGVNLTDNNFESFEQRLRRIESERNTVITPNEQATQEFKRLTTQQDTMDNSTLDQRFRQEHENRNNDTQFSQPTQVSQLQQPSQVAYNPNYSEPKHVTFSEPLITEPKEPSIVIGKSIDDYTLILNNIINKEKIIDEKLRDLEIREKNFLELQIKKKDIKSLFNFNFQHIIIDTKSFDNTSLNAYVYNFNIPLRNVTRIQILNISIPILNYNIGNKQYFEYYIEDQEHSIHVPRGNYNINQLLELINNRTTDEFKLKLNPITDCIFVDTKLQMQIKKNLVSKKLGLDASTIGTRPYDLRIINYLSFYIKNIFQEKTICRVNPYNFTPIDIIFNEPLELDRLEIEFRDNDNIIIDFEGRHHIIEMRVFNEIK